MLQVGHFWEEMKRARHFSLLRRVLLHLLADVPASASVLRPSICVQMTARSLREAFQCLMFGRLFVPLSKKYLLER